MTISKQEAARVLQEIDTAQQRTSTMLGYRAAAPYCLLWGCIRLLANLSTEFVPALAHIWNVLTPVGILLSMWIMHRQVQPSRTGLLNDGKASRWRYALAWLIIIGFITATIFIMHPINARQMNAFISFFWAFLYALIGLWTGWRIVAIGIATAATVLIGYTFITAHFNLWMALAVDSLLILGSLWLRKV